MKKQDYIHASLLLSELMIIQHELIRDPLDLAAYIETWGVEFSSACDESTSETLFKEVLAIRAGVLGSDNLKLADTLSTLSTLYYFQGRWKQSAELEEQALKIRERHPDARHAQAISHRDLGILDYEQGLYAEAQAEFENALNVFMSEKPLPNISVADGLNNLAEVYRAQGDYSQAEDRFSRALEQAKRSESNNPGLLARILNNWAGLEKDRGRYANAELALKRALDIIKSLPADSFANLSDLVLNLAEIYRLQGNYADAEREYKRALKLVEQVSCPDNPVLMWYYNQLALTYTNEGKTADAEPLFRKALGLVERTMGSDHLLAAKSRHDLAGLLSSRGRYREAEQLYRRALSERERWLGLDHPDVAETLIQLGALLLREGKTLDAAMGDADRAIAILERDDVYPDLAIEVYDLKANLLKRLGQSHDAIETLDKALRSVEKQRTKIGGGDRTRTDYLERYVDLYCKMVEWQIAAGNTEKAIEFTERYRARVLEDHLALAGVDLREHILPKVKAALETREAESRRRIARLQKQVDVELRQSKPNPETLISLKGDLEIADREYERVQEEFKSQSLPWTNLTGKIADFKEMLQAIPHDGAILIYQIGREKSFAFLLQQFPARPKVFPLIVDEKDASMLGVVSGPVTSDKLYEMLALGYERNSKKDHGAEALSFPRPESMTNQATRLHALWRVLLPVELWMQVDKACEVVIVPDGALHHLPFEQLVISLGGQDRYWLDAGPIIRYAPSVSSLYTLMNRKHVSPIYESSKASIVSISDPLYEGSEEQPDRTESPPSINSLKRYAASVLRQRLPLARLQKSADETAEILAAFRQEALIGDDALALMGSDATEEAVRSALPGRRFIHLAAHGIVDQSRSELFAGLMLAPPPRGEEENIDAGNDGFLQLFEIYNLDLVADLVVLSACDSGIGVPRAGEGTFALSRGFMAAGASRVVASLWSVADDSTSVLMQEYFRQILSDYKAGRPINYALALRDAKQRIRQDKKWASPFYWAPFVLVGLN